MSLPWNRSLQLQVGTRSVVGTLRAGWSGGRTLARSTRDISVADAADGEGAAAACSEAMDAVLTELRSTPGGIGRSLSVFLAGGWVHFDVATGDFCDASERHLQTIAEACVDDVLGHQPSPRVVRWQLQPGMQHLLIAAMDASGVETVVQVATRHRLRLVSLQPTFCLHWNQNALSRSLENGVFAVVDGVHADVGYVRNGAVAAWSSGHCDRVPVSSGPDGAGRGALDERTDRLLASLGESADAVPVFAVSVLGDGDLAVAPRWVVSRDPQEPA